jgi:phospholipid/cholesterol/gamma-HCH transport system ATP-binding protein
MSPTPLIKVQDLSNQLSGQWVHKGLDLTVNQGEILAIVGGSGSGKTVLLRTILMLRQATSGKIEVFDVETTQCSEAQAIELRHRWGVLFQHDALFSSLTVLENVQFPLRAFTNLPDEAQEKIALLKIAMAGLAVDVAGKYPSELSGGMQKRAALARAIALDPELLFLDEPTAGLDPQSASTLDELIMDLQKSLGLTVVLITHDLDSVSRLSDRVAFLGDGKVIANLPFKELIKYPHPLIQEYFSGYRGQRYLDN